jgi:hypothetical protein
LKGEVARRIVYFAYLANKPDDIAYFNELSGCLKKQGWELVGLDQGGVRNWDGIQYPVFGLPRICKEGANSGTPFGVMPELAALIAIGAETDSGALGSKTRNVKYGLEWLSWFFSYVLAKWKPSLVILGHQFSGQHLIARHICEQFEVPYIYHHAGVLPGTVIFEEQGQMAESLFATNPEHYNSSEIRWRDREIAKEYLLEGRRNPITRPGRTLKGELSCQDWVTAQKAEGKKIIFYAGINDYRTGVLPRCFPNSKLHSPFYEGTYHGLSALVKLCEQNDWRLIFKPHPNTKTLEIPSEIQESCVFVVEKDAEPRLILTQVDCTVTIVSQLAYEACIERHPVVLLGNLQISGTGACYEATSPEELQPVLGQAIQDGYTAEMEQKFEDHVAILLSRYLFSWNQRIREIMGRGPEDAAVYIIQKAQYGSDSFHYKPLITVRWLLAHLLVSLTHRLKRKFSALRK